LFVSDIQRADPWARGAALVIVVVAFVIGGIAVPLANLFGPALDAWFAADLENRAAGVLRLVAVFVSGSATLAAAYIWWVGHRIVRSRRYPPPGLRVLHDTVVLTGDTAESRGRLMRMIALAIGISGILLAGFVWRLVSLLPIPR
jgi:hypothetical protein